MLHDLGVNFALLGLIENPCRLSQFRLQSEVARLSDAVIFDPDLGTKETWTDGSVLWQENFWITTAAYAVIDKEGRVLHSGRVRRWSLSSYVVELWAIWIAFSQSDSAVHIYCDNQTVATSSSSPTMSPASEGVPDNMLDPSTVNAQGSSIFRPNGQGLRFKNSTCLSTYAQSCECRRHFCTTNGLYDFMRILARTPQKRNFLQIHLAGQMDQSRS